MDNSYYCKQHDWIYDGKSIDSRSTNYSSDLAKGFEIPIVHVNADDPEACMIAADPSCM